MIAAVDTNILMDIIGEYTALHAESAGLLEKYASEGSLIMSPITYSEFLAAFLNGFEEKEAIGMAEGFMKDFGIRVTDFNEADFVLAAKAWRLFPRQNRVVCPKCSELNSFFCKKCKSKVQWRNHMITDFLIGAHAQNHAEVLLTRDRGYCKKYFQIKVLP